MCSFNVGLPFKAWLWFSVNRQKCINKIMDLNGIHFYYKCLFSISSCFNLLCFRRSGVWHVGSSGPSSSPVWRKVGVDHANLYGERFQARAPGSQLEVGVTRTCSNLSNQSHFKRQAAGSRGNHHSGNRQLAVVQLLRESQATPEAAKKMAHGTVW